MSQNGTDDLCITSLLLFAPTNQAHFFICFGLSFAIPKMDPSKHINLECRITGFKFVSFKKKKKDELMKYSAASRHISIHQ